MNATISKQEFQIRRTKFDATYRKFAYVQVGFALGSLFFFYIFDMALWQKLHPWSRGGLIFEFVIFFVVARMLKLKEDSLPKKCGCVCPLCDKPIVGLQSDVVVATSKCPNCGAEILS
jgi:hypothetical protein